MTRAVIFIFIFAFALAACFSPTYENPTCPSGECPPGYTCGPDNVCRVDGTVTDAPTPSCQEDGPDLECPAASPLCIDGACSAGCDVDTECSGRPPDERICHAASGGCVECDEDDRQADPPMSSEDECPDPAMAVCDEPTHTCRECQTNEECFVGICSAGRCAPENEIVFLDTTGADGGDCGSRASPCLTLNAAIDKVQANPTFKYIFLSPSATPYQARNNLDRADFDNVDVHVIGSGARVVRNGIGTVLELRLGADVTIEGLTIQGTTKMSGHGIQCSDSTLRLRSVSVLDGGGSGILASGCMLSVVGSTIAANGRIGIEASSSELELLRSTINSNQGGGVALTSGTVKIINNFVVANGSPVSSIGGLKVAPTGASNLLEFNTIVGNVALAGYADSLDCANPALVARNNIIVGSAGQSHATGTCAHVYTLFTPDNAVAGEANSVVADPAMYNFVSNTDYHIRAGSIAVARAQNTDLVGESGVDVDGNVRSGNQVDVGADEIQ